MRVLLADDHSMVRQGIRLYLESQNITIVGEAVNGLLAVEMATELKPDVVIMDIHMPELTGIEATRRILFNNPDIRILVLTAYDTPAYVHALLDAGADGFILKTAEFDELYRALHEVAVGRMAFDDEIMAKLALSVEESTPLIEALTKREIEILTHVGYGKTNKEIGKDLFISDRTVQGHLKNVYAKLDVTTRTEAVAVGLQHGFIVLDGGYNS